MQTMIAEVLTGTREVPVTYDVRTGTWRLLEAFRYYLPTGTMELPAGFESDLASIPRVVWSLIAPFELGILPPLLHDYLYRHGGQVPGWTWTRAQADAEFYRAMCEEGVSAWRARSAYTAVRLFGWRAWRG